MPITETMISKNDLQASILKDSFFEFVQYFWSTIVPESPVWNWHIEYICSELQIVAERVFKNEPKLYDLVINVPPGSTKSTICSIMFPAWVWTRMASARTICGSYSHTLSMELSRKCRNVIQSEKYQELFLEVEIVGDQNTKEHYVTSEEGGRYCTSTGGAVTGFHGHFIIVDDPLNPMEAKSEVELKKANDWIIGTLFTRKVEKKVTPIILIMQRLHELDPTGAYIERSKEKDTFGKPKVVIKHINLPSEINSKNEKDVRPRSLRRMYTADNIQKGSKLLDPKRMSREVLNEARATLLEYGYAGQFLQIPVPPEGGMFKIERLRIEDNPPVSADFVEKVRAWDKAGTLDGGAYTVGLLMGKDTSGRFWILDVIRKQLDSGEREQLIKLTAQLDGMGIAVAIEQEPGSGGKESAQNTVKNLAGWITDVDRPTGKKEVRALPFSSQVNIGNVCLVKAEWNNEYVNEMKLFPKSRYKDQIDASSGAFTAMTAACGRIGVIK